MAAPRYPSYVRVWPAQTAIEYNRDYAVQDVVGFDTRQGEPYPFAPMEWEAAMGRAPEFAAFIQQLLPFET
jgi:hypothetical protein